MLISAKADIVCSFYSLNLYMVFLKLSYNIADVSVSYICEH